MREIQNNSARAPEVLIVGAGPTGLVAAIELARHGVGVTIVDRDSGPTPFSKAVGIGAHTLELLEDSGVTERLLARGIKIRHAYVWHHGRRIAALDTAALEHRFDFLLSLPQSATETILAETLASLGVDVTWNTALANLLELPDGVTVRLAHDGGEREAEFAYVFGADGAHSATRSSLGIPFEGHTHERTWSIADVELPHWPHEPDAANLFLHDDGDLAFIIPVGESRFRVISNTSDALPRLPSAGRDARTLRTDEFELPVRQAATYQSRRVFLGGDAAHVHSPVGARGMNLGVEDAASFARRLVAHELAGYTAERRPIGSRWIEISERVLAAAQATNPLVRATRDTALRLVGHSRALQRRVLRRVSGLVE
jgi:2-polyprenyl-6-methoxyphenol hydroxylase-like FAD-dependent oxidoreductase